MSLVRAINCAVEYKAKHPILFKFFKFRLVAKFKTSCKLAKIGADYVLNSQDEEIINDLSTIKLQVGRLITLGDVLGRDTTELSELYNKLNCKLVFLVQDSIRRDVAEGRYE